MMSVLDALASVMESFHISENEELYVLNTDSYAGTKQYGDHIFRRGVNSTRYADVFEQAINAGVRNAFAGRSVACVDRLGRGQYGVAAASYGAELHLYEMLSAVRALPSMRTWRSAS